MGQRLRTSPKSGPATGHLQLVLVISDRHLPLDDRLRLPALPFVKGQRWAVSRDDSGTWVVVPPPTLLEKGLEDARLVGLSDALPRLVAEAHASGANIVRLEPRARVLRGLPTYPN